MNRYRKIHAQLALADRERIERDNADKIEKHGALTIFRQESGRPDGRCFAKVWRGAAVKPVAYYQFSTEAAREEWIENVKRLEDQRQDERAERKQRQAERAEQELAATSVGDFLYRTWGYDQTNVDFYQVVGKTAARLKVRPVQYTLQPGEGRSDMSGMVTPNRDEFKGPERLVVPGEFSKWEGRPVYCSWYA